MRIIFFFLIRLLGSFAVLTDPTEFMTVDISTLLAANLKFARLMATKVYWLTAATTLKSSSRNPLSWRSLTCWFTEIFLIR